MCFVTQENLLDVTVSTRKSGEQDSAQGDEALPGLKLPFINRGASQMEDRLVPQAGTKATGWDKAAC